MPGSSSTLKLQTNVPETIALKFADGLPVLSPFSGDQIMFSLTDDRKLYLAPVAAKKITNAGFQQGELFSICKREVTHGNRRVIDYQVEKVSGTAVPGESPAGSSSAGVTSSSDSRPQSNSAIHAVKAPPASPAGASSVPGVPAAGEGAVNPQNTIGWATALMKASGVGAIDAVLEIERYAQSRGMVDFGFGADNIQRLASTIFIELTKKGARA